MLLDIGNIRHRSLPSEQWGGVPNSWKNLGNGYRNNFFILTNPSKGYVPLFGLNLWESESTISQMYSNHNYYSNNNNTIINKLGKDAYNEFYNNPTVRTSIENMGAKLGKRQIYETIMAASVLKDPVLGTSVADEVNLPFIDRIVKKVDEYLYSSVNQGFYVMRSIDYRRIGFEETLLGNAVPCVLDGEGGQGIYGGGLMQCVSSDNINYSFHTPNKDRSIFTVAYLDVKIEDVPYIRLCHLLGQKIESRLFRLHILNDAGITNLNWSNAAKNRMRKFKKNFGGIVIENNISIMSSLFSTKLEAPKVSILKKKKFNKALYETFVKYKSDTEAQSNNVLLNN
jgi:hypothetical protein